MLNLRIVRGPLKEMEKQFVLREYNRLTTSSIPMENFERWTQHSPEGPAFHAFVETENGEIAGHFSLIPLRAKSQAKTMVAAKAEYFFVLEDFRNEQVHGFENSGKPVALVLLDQLYRHCQSQGWGPFLISAPTTIHPLHMLTGCRPADFELQEGLLILRPIRAARGTPNLTTAQRAVFFFFGLIQGAIWRIISSANRSNRKVGEISASAAGALTTKETAIGQLGFFRDQESVRWRYPNEQYIGLCSNGASGGLIAKRGNAESFLRVCHSDSIALNEVRPLAASLIHQAILHGDAGVRWAVYGKDEITNSIVCQLRTMGFFCMPRVRRLLIHTKDRELLTPEKWRISDAFFNFDL